MNRIDQKFNDLRKTHKKAFIAFITAGYPSLKTTQRLVLEFARSGVDILELGVPFSDPMADGPVIQEASQEALKKNTRLIDILNLVKKARKRVQMPICLMTYYNPVFCFGEREFIRKAKQCGVDGVIIPDLPPEEAGEFIKSLNKAGLDIICFLSPTSTTERIKFISGVSRGFIYYVSLTGVTGARQGLSLDLKNNIKRIKRYTNKPVCVGFGVSNRNQVKKINRFADGVIVGSVIVRKIKENRTKADLVKKVANFVKGLK
ncbi:MAG: tryptophan synthase subunit alpha [Candidatus Omnitrophica bacterium]|nr:tryptophan synthase subunit alpha [Candidatus Omnitrophota bacterium]